MGVYIKGMKMPRNCEKCLYLSWSNFYQIYVCNAIRRDEPVLFDHKQVKSTATVRGGRADNCPLVHVQPHGRMINADALIVAMLDHGVDHVQTDDLEEINQIINDAHTADAVPVVRCRECKYGYPLGLGEYTPYIYCVKPYAGNWPTHKPDWFCADGKRKEDQDGSVQPERVHTEV